jgi:glycine betaine/proline transport system ATP-binding protein
VLSAGGLMQPPSAAALTFRRVKASAKIESFAPEIVDSPTPFAVENAAGEVIGEVTPRDVIDVLAGKARGTAA